MRYPSPLTQNVGNTSIERPWRWVRGVLDPSLTLTSPLTYCHRFICSFYLESILDNPWVPFPLFVSSQWLLFDWLVLPVKRLLSEGPVRGEWGGKSTPHWFSVPLYKGIPKDLSEGWWVSTACSSNARIIFNNTALFALRKTVNCSLTGNILFPAWEQNIPAVGICDPCWPLWQLPKLTCSVTLSNAILYLN